MLVLRPGKPLMDESNKLSIVWTISGQVSSSYEDYDDVPGNKIKPSFVCHAAFSFC
jgi:hypothetical protein